MITLFILFYLFLGFLFALSWCIDVVNNNREHGESGIKDSMDMIAAIIVIVIIMIGLPYFLILDIKHKIKIYKEFELPDWQKSISTYRPYWDGKEENYE